MTEVEIFWPATLPSTPALEAEELLRNAGIKTACRLQPVRRGAETVLVLLTHAALEPLFGAMFAQLGGDAWNGIAVLVKHLLKHTGGRPAPKCVIFESAANGAQFIFTTDLPESAFRQAIKVDPGPQPGRWTWDRDRWVRFEDR